MSKPIRWYPRTMQKAVVDRRMRMYDPKPGAHNGLGVLSAAEYYYKTMGLNIAAVRAAPKAKGRGKKQFNNRRAKKNVYTV